MDYVWMEMGTIMRTGEIVEGSLMYFPSRWQVILGKVT